MPNTDLVLKMYEYFNAGDLERVRTELFAEDITWRMPGHHPLSGEHAGADQVMAFFGALSKAGIQVDNVHFGELENGIVIERHMGHAAIGGDHFDFPTATSYEIEDGRLKRVQVHTADQHNVDRYMWTVFGLKPIGERLVD